MTISRVLHVVANLRHGGVQTWIMDLARQGREEGVEMDILTYSDQYWPLSDELEAIGVRVFSCTGHRNPVRLLRCIQALVRERGGYQAIHAHEMYQNGALMLAARRAGITLRISHAHNSSQAVRSTPLRRVYNRLMQMGIARAATHMLAVSELAGRKLYGPAWRRDSRTAIVHCGLDFRPYAAPRDAAVRRELGIPVDAKVIGHAGRFVDQKNHLFLVEVAARAMARQDDIWLLLVGDGPNRVVVERRAKDLGIAGRTVFTGARSDVPRIVVGCFDMLLLPSLFEGLGLVVLEAMAAGKPCVISDVVPPEADVVAPLVTRVTLSADVSTWAQAVLDALRGRTDSREAYETVERSAFSIMQSYGRMRAIYFGKADHG